MYFMALWVGYTLLVKVPLRIYNNHMTMWEKAKAEGRV